MKTTMTLAELRATIVAAFPDLVQADHTLLTEGWDCVAVDVADRLIFKFPRHAVAEAGLVREAAILEVVRARVTMTVPDLTLHHAPGLFSRHTKLRGGHLLAHHYEALPSAARERLAADLARFYAELHALDPADLRAAGAEPVHAWPAPERILERTWPVLPPELRAYAEHTIAAWQRLGEDPGGTTYGHFDGHGWNMAFDAAAGRLDGVYDFADSGFGPLHQEFIHTNWIAADLTERIVGTYEALTGRALDRERIAALTGVRRLADLANYAHDPEQAPTMIAHVASWAAAGR